MASYVYSASGAKLSVTYTNGATATTNQYCGNMLYENGTLKQILIDGGYITFSGTTPQYHFYLKDHLGNNRVVVSAGGTVEQVNHYYPYGGLMGESTNGDLQRFKYNGKELDRMHGLDWYDYGARHMSADIGRFTTQDRYAEKYYDTSPYVYCKDNPIKRIDINGDSTVVDIYGKVVHNDDKDKAVYLYYNKKTEKIGEKGGKINVNKILPRTLRRNSNEAKQIKSIITFIKNVKTGGNWDLKNNTKTIWGLAKNSTFLYNKQNLSSEDVGNMNFGVVAKSYGFSQETALRGAGLYQIYERHSTSEWINGTTITAYRANQFGIVSPVSVEVLGSPYGDDPRDQYWINQGYNFK